MYKKIVWFAYQIDTAVKIAVNLLKLETVSQRLSPVILEIAPKFEARVLVFL